jgi:hypothetical protein
VPGRKIGQVRHDTGGDHSFGVVRDHHSANGANAGCNVPADPRFQDAADRAALLHVEANKLLVVGHYPGFSRRGSIAINQYAVITDAVASEDVHKLTPTFVAADHPTQINTAAQGSDVVRNIGRATELQCFRGDIHNGYWRFGRDPADWTPNILVQNQISDDENFAAFELPDVRLKTGGFHGGASTG